MVLTTATTMAGFVGLATNPIPSVQRFAWLAALGVGVTCGLTVVVLPAWLRLFHRPRAASWRHPVTGPITRLVRSTRAGVTRPLRVVSLGLLASGLLGLAGTRLAVDTDPLRVLPHSDSFRAETERVAEVLGGRATLDVLLPPPQPGFGAAGLLLEIGKLALLLAAVAVGFRSLSTGLVALVPNVVPCVVVYGALELCGRPLTVANSMIGSVMLGLIVDDTIHFLHAYRHARADGLDRATAAGAALDTVGHALVATSLVLSAGFAGGLLGELDSTRELSLLSAATIGSSLLANLYLLPALLVLPDSLRRLHPAAAGAGHDLDTATEPCQPRRITTS